MNNMLTKHYPQRLLESPEFLEMQEALGDPVFELRSALYSFGEQLNVNTATYGLCAWETALGINVDVSKSDTERRERIMSKLRGTGAVTAEMIENVARSFAGGEVTVIEDPANYTFIVKFSGQYGVPHNIDAVTAAINEIKPAHLGFTYEYSYLLIREVHGVMTLTELEQTPLKLFAGGA